MINNHNITFSLEHLQLCRNKSYGTPNKILLGIILILLCDLETKLNLCKFELYY